MLNSLYNQTFCFPEDILIEGNSINNSLSSALSNMVYVKSAVSDEIINLNNKYLSIECLHGKMLLIDNISKEMSEAGRSLSFRLSSDETNSQLYYPSFSDMLDNKKLIITKGSVIDFYINDLPSMTGKVSLTISAKKRKRVPSDSAVLKLSGWFKILSGEERVLSASLTGDIYGQRDVFGVSSFGVISEELRESVDWTSSWFYDDLSIVATDYNSDLQHATVHIKNMSKKNYELIFTPVSWVGLGYDYKSSIDNTILDLPDNCQIVGNSILVKLSPNGDL